MIRYHALAADTRGAHNARVQPTLQIFRAQRPLAHGLVLWAGVLTGSCGSTAHSGDVEVSVIGDRFRRTDPDQGTLDRADAMLGSATAMGLVALDGNGQVEPALAESWIVTGDGLSTIFRIRPAQWPNGDQVTGEEVAASLNRALAPDSRNPLKPLLSAVDTVIGMTGRVVEVRLKVPRPNLLQLLAQPELGIRRRGEGSGPYRIARGRITYARLRAIPAEDAPPDAKADEVTLRTERTARAVARFVADRSDLVSGGTLADWPIVTVAKPRPGRLRFDPVQGLFGFAIVGRIPFLADSDVRAALAMAIDRRGLASTMGIGGWTISETLLPSRLDSADDPARPNWVGNALAQRRADAAGRIAEWRGSARAVPILRVALPEGPGMRILFASVTADWRRIGVTAVAVPWRSTDADMRLIDAVAPNASANWYLTMVSCASGLVCDAQGDDALEASRTAETLEARSAKLTLADERVAIRGSFIPLGVPIRWSLVDPTLTGWHENLFGAHPLSELRPAANVN